MARTSFHLECDFLQTASNANLQIALPEITDNFNVGKHTFNMAVERATKRVCRQNINRSNRLEIIPEVNFNSVTNLSDVGDINDERAEKSVISNYEGDMYINDSTVYSNSFILPENRELFQCCNNVNNTWQSERKLLSDTFPKSRALRSDEASTAITSIPSVTTMTSGKTPEQNLNSTRRNSDLKSGILVWISHGDRTSITETNRNKSFAVNNNSNYHNSNDVPCRIPVMVKVYQSSSGCYALMTPSRSHKGQTQPFYLGLRRSHVTVEDSDNSSVAPCCLILTLSGRDGKSFKFEARSKASAEEWAHALSSKTTAERVKTSVITRATPWTHTEPDITKSESSCLQCDKNNNNNNNQNDTGPVMESSGSGSFRPFTARKTHERRNQYRSPQVNSQFRRESQMPTLSESSDENDEE